MTPGTPQANNGNWRTAHRWSGYLAGVSRAIVQTEWRGEDADVVIALHARRSADSIARVKAARPDIPLVVVLTGTDLYRDLPQGDTPAQRSVELADRLVALQDDAPRFLDARLRRRCDVIFQSCPRLAAGPNRARAVDFVAVGHLRDEKDPRTLWRAMALLDPALAVRVRHVGDALDPALGREAGELMAREPRFRWRGALPHGLARIAIRCADVLVHPSRMEGGANVVVEAVMSGTPVIASRISGNVGMLGRDYPGYFEPGDARALAALVEAAAREPRFLGGLREACDARRPLFSPAREKRAVRALLSTRVRRGPG